MASFNHQFLSTFLRHQPFDLPDSMIYYILKNPSFAKVYQKLIQSCKYFFIKNPILVFHCLEIDDNGWKTCSNNGNCEEVEFHQAVDSRSFSSCKFWIDHRIRIHSTDSKAASDLFPSIYESDATKCYFANQRMSLQQFLLYAQMAEDCKLENVILSSDVCAEIPIEEIVAKLPNISKISIKYGPDSKNASSDTVKKLLKIPHFKNVTKLRVVDASEKFDIVPIYKHYKNNRSPFTFDVVYQNGLSKAMTEKINGVVDEIFIRYYELRNKNTPFIGYPEQSVYDHNLLLEVQERSLFSR